MNDEITDGHEESNALRPTLKQRIVGYGSTARRFVEFCGRHRFLTGLFALLSVAALLLSIVGYRLDRQEATDTSTQVQRVEEKIDMIVNGDTASVIGRATYRDCDDQQVYLAVIESARNMPEPYANWTVKGSSEIRTIEPGQCEMTILFVTGDPTGKMQEINVKYKTDVPISSIRIQLAKTEDEECENIILGGEQISTLINGEIAPGDIDCYYLTTSKNRTVRIAVDSEFKNTAATVLGVGDARDQFEFITAQPVYEIRMFQLKRSVGNDRYALTVSIR